jgi:hypothetical protein
LYEVVGNRVVTQNPNATAIGLVGERGATNAPLIEQNQISSGGSYEAIGLYGNVSDARVANNLIHGHGPYGISLVAFSPDQVAESNTIAGNNLTRFKADLADLFLDAHTRNTVVIGRFGTVIDLGTGNQIGGR